MNRITIEKVILLEALETNRQIHESDYKDALEGYRKAAIAQLQRTTTELELGNTDVSLWLNLSKPHNHTADYDRAISMLGFHTGDTIEITATEFDKFVNDDWDWKNEFTQVTSAYIAQ